MKKWAAILCVLTLLTLSSACAQEERLYPARQGEKWGYINRQGEMVIAPQFAWAGEFRGGGFAAVAASSADRSDGVIDRTGSYVLEPHYSLDEGYDGLYYSGRDTGLILCGDDGDSYGYFDVVNGFFSGLNYDNLFLHSVGDSGLIPFTQGDVSTSGTDSFNLGYLKRADGTVAIPCRYDSDYWCGFTGGWALAVVPDAKQERKFVFINTSGEELALPEGLIPEGSGCSDGMLCVRASDTGLCGYVTPDGTLALPAVYDSAYDFDGGRAKVTYQGVDGWIDLSGAFTAGTLPAAAGQAQATLSYEPGEDDTSGRVQVVRADGTVTIPFSAGYTLPVDYSFGCYDYFADGLQPLCQGDKYGYVDPDGKVVVPFVWEEAEGFLDGLARVTRDGRMAYIDTAGQIVWQEQ